MGNFVLVFTCSKEKRIISVSGDFTEAVHRNIAKAMHLHTKEMNHKDMWKTPLLGHSSHCQVPAPHMVMRVGSFRMHVFSGATVQCMVQSYSLLRSTTTSTTGSASGMRPKTRSVVLCVVTYSPALYTSKN